MPVILLKRAYDSPEPSDGARILVERLWPRGLSKKKAHIDAWMKEAAPSTELRRWFNHDPRKWKEFKRRYYRELRLNSRTTELLIKLCKSRRVTFVFASKDIRYNNAVALKEFFKRRI